MGACGPWNMTDSAGALLIVDDNEDNRYTLTRRLQREGYTDLTPAADGEQALALLASRAFDLVLLDVMMPGLNGYQVLERMRADPRLRDIPVIMISANDQLESVVRCIELGAEDYLAKPFNPTLLRARTGASLEKKRMRDEIARHVRRMERELDAARAIQLSMVPSMFPAWSVEQPLAVHATLQPAREVGGDLYDCFWLAPDKLCIVVADVSDKGASAALYMARTRTVVRLLAKLLGSANGVPPGAEALLVGINDELCRDNPHAMFVTMLLCVVDARTGDFEWCNAGHTVPYLVDHARRVTALDETRSIPVGIRSAARFAINKATLAPGDALFFYTDGVTEAANGAGEFYGEARLEAALLSSVEEKPQRLVEAVLRDVRAFAGEAAPSDDIAALACRWGP
jgi:phosphoserine phosphatase RsbU/P